MIENIEKTLIATFIDNYDLFEETSLKSENFYDVRYAKIFEVLKKLHKKELPFDENLIIKELGASYESVLIEILATTSVTNVRSYEKMIIEDFEKRELYKFLKTRINELENDFDNNQSHLSVIHQLNNYQVNTSFTNLFNIESTRSIKATKPEILISNICPVQKKEINLFTSKGGVGKSYTLLYLMMELQKTGLSCFGFFSEDAKGVTKDRLEILKKTHQNLQNIEIDILGKESRLQNFIKADKNGNFEISDYFFQFQKAMKPYDVIVIDPLISLIFKDENSNVEARYLMNLLNAWIEKENKTLLLIHHESKGENSGSRGASAFVDAVRIHYTVSKIENDAEKRKLKLEKANHYSGDKNEFIVKLFNKNIPLVIEWEEKNNQVGKEESSNCDFGAIEILYDESPKEETLKLKKEKANKGVLFDD